jgi:arsenate reductase-like glutaredoxin family protein
MKKDAPTDQELLAVMLGPTGNLRAPTVRRGRTLLVGFHEDAYRELL